MASYLQVENISKSYGDRTLFSDISFNINEGDKIALVAPNGTGKSSLLKILAGVEHSDRGGEVKFMKDIKVAFLDQESHFDPKHSIFDEVYARMGDLSPELKEYEHAVASGDIKRLERAIAAMDASNGWGIEQKIRQVLSSLKIERWEQPMGELSGGEAKRVALACMILQDADFIIMDEPTNHLDIDIIEYLEGYLQRSRCTLLMVTHFGAADRDRTGTDFTPRDFKSLVSACSTTAASVGRCYGIIFYAHRQALQLIQIPPEGLQTVFDKPCKLRSVHGAHSCHGLLGSGIKFHVARLLLFDAFDIRRQLIRRFYNGIYLLIALQHKRSITLFQFRRQHCQKPFPGDPLHLFIGILDVRIVILDGCRQIPCQDLGSIMIQRRHSAPVRIRPGQSQNFLPDQRQRMGQHRHLMAVLLNILRKGIAHQPPAGNIAHSAQQGIKLICHRSLL